jgi:hypothetical protein
MITTNPNIALLSIWVNLSLALVGLLMDTLRRVVSPAAKGVAAQQAPDGFRQPF